MKRIAFKKNDPLWEKISGPAVLTVLKILFSDKQYKILNIDSSVGFHGLRNTYIRYTIGFAQLGFGSLLFSCPGQLNR